MDKIGNMTYAEAKAFAIAALLRAAEAHEQRQYGDIRKDYDVFDFGLPRGKGPEFDKLHIALNFWDGWIDASNHDWNFHEPINCPDWPLLARLIVNDLRADSEISNPVVLKEFDYKNQPHQPPLLQKIASLLGFSKWVEK